MTTELSIAQSITNLLKTDNVIINYGINMASLASAALIVDQIPAIKNKISEFLAPKSSYIFLTFSTNASRKRL